MKKLISLIILFATCSLSQGQEVGVPQGATKVPVAAQTCTGTDKISAVASDGTVTCTADEGGAGGVPTGSIVFILSGTCAAGWTEVAALDGLAIYGTVALHADVGSAVGSASITPTVNSLTAAAQTFTGSLSTTSSDSAGTPSGTNSAPTITVDALTGGGRKGGTTNPASIIENGNVPTASASAPVFTGSALAGHSHTVTPLGSNSTSAVTGTLNSFVPQFSGVKVIFCSKD